MVKKRDVYHVTPNSKSGWDVQKECGKRPSVYADTKAEAIARGNGKLQYLNCTSILILADGGGSNSSRHYIFKEDLQKLVDEIGVEIRMAHFPPYTSKWNPIEHRLFHHITRSLKGVILKSHDYVKELIENTTTLTGLKVKAHIIKKIYKTGRKYADNFKKTMRIVFDDCLGQWNYRAIPGKA